MASDINRKLRSLEARRKGTDRLGSLSLESLTEALAKSNIPESYSKRAPGKDHTTYTLGAMQSVDSDSTRISHEEADRVKRQLQKGFKERLIDVDFRLQGSVACDIHIRGFSDVDLLLIDDRYFRYQHGGKKAVAGGYTNPVTYDTLQKLIQLRSDAEIILSNAFPKADLKKDGAKSINLSGGSLRRSVDVVPSNWFDTLDYQRTSDESDRGIEILDTAGPQRLLNTPFKHIKLIGAKDSESLGGLKKAIRLCKNVKADAEEDGTKISLTSYDIASLLWYANMAALTVGVANELAILAEATRFMDYLVRNRPYAMSLDVPDKSRKIFDTEAKLEGLRLLSLEMDDLSEKVASEQSSLLILRSDRETLLGNLRKTYIAG